MTKTYRVIRYRRDADNEILVRGLTFEQAQEHCNRADTMGDGWFDGYVEEPDPVEQARKLALNVEGLYLAATDTPERFEQDFRRYVAQHGEDIDVDRIDYADLIERITAD